MAAASVADDNGKLALQLAAESGCSANSETWRVLWEASSKAGREGAMQFFVIKIAAALASAETSQDVEALLAAAPDGVCLQPLPEGAMQA